MRVPATDVVGGRYGRSIEDEAAAGLGGVCGVDDRLEQQRVAGDQSYAGADEHRVVSLGLEPLAGFVGTRLAEVDQAVVDVVARDTQRGDIVVVGGPQLLRGEAGKLGEVG